MAKSPSGNKPAKKKTGPTPLESIKHKDARVNIPTEELRDFVADDENTPKKMLYPRDPSLDPQLVWKGKDEQDSQPLEVPVVPIYIQEKIHPQALIENLRNTARAGEQEPELTLFDDFNGIEDFDKKVDFYHHDQHWSNRMILGDSLLVMTSLAEKEGLKGKVQTIYFDPPYGIKFGSNWQVSTRRRDVKDGSSDGATRQPEQIRAFRDTWHLGIHSFLSYFRDRLVVARELMTASGSLFVQIGDENVHLLRAILDEVFGSQNFVQLIAYKRLGMMVGETIQSSAHFLIWYAKDKSAAKFRKLFTEQTAGVGSGDHYTQLENRNTGAIRAFTAQERQNPNLLSEEWRPFQLVSLSTGGYRPNTTVDYVFEGRTYHPGPNKCWRTTVEGLNRLCGLGRIAKAGNTIRYKQFLDDFPLIELGTLWEDTGRDPDSWYVVQTPSNVIRRCVLMTSDPGDIVLDPTCGSGTSAYVAEQWGRRWITVDTSRVALTLARTRLMSAKFPYYVLSDSVEGIRKEAEITGKIPPEHTTEGDVRKGFVYKRVPHVTLKAIANNPEIRGGMTRQETDAAIAKHAETEILYDKPFEDSKRIRVTGPFTVESLSPHRVLTADDKRPATESAGQRDTVVKFETMILDNLLKAGVQNTKKKERLKFERLEPHAGVWIHATGDYIDSDGKSKRVAVSIGPEHGTVGPQQVKEAAKEAVQGVGYDLLIVCGFAFDPHVSEEVKRYGSLTVLPARMNPDLSMGDELLKKTGAGNLFMVFGEPDIKVTADSDGNLTVELHGVDVYDPTTGQIRSSSTDDVACWFIDTDYNGESFFVRHAYFTGADEPYEKLKRALRAEIDEAAWQTLYSTVSRPFASPETGKIAVKVINHYGDEVLKVYEVVRNDE
jgi:adenine-specific DNA-methyltransferase